MASHTDGFNGSTFETLESRVMMTGAFPSAAQNAIVYDAQGNLNVAYYDSTAHNLKYVQQSPAGVWTQPVVIDGSSSDVGKYVTIAINGDGFPAVAYQDSANANLKFAQFNGSSWTVTTVDKRKTTGFNPSLTFDKNGTGYISYYKQNTGDLDLATLKNHKWTLSTLQSSGNVGQFSSVAINPATGKPAVAYTNGSGSVQYVASNGKNFAKPVTVGKTAKTMAGSVSLAFGDTGAAVGFVDAGTGNVNLGQISGKTVSTSTVGTVSTTGNASAQVLIDPTTNKPAVVYHDSTGVYVAAPTSNGTGFQTTQVQTGGSNTTATIQPGSGSIVFSTVNGSGGTLSVNTTVAPPDAPSDVAASAASTTSATLSWTDNSNNEAGFLIERSIDNASFTTVATTQPNTSAYTDTGLTEGTLYYYRVSAIGAAGNNSAGTTSSGAAQIVPAAGIATVTTLAAAPSAVAASPASATSVNVTWTNNSHQVTGFIINRSSDGGTTWTRAGMVGATVATFTDTGLTEGANYSYQVVAYNVSGGTAGQPASTSTLPAAPTGVSATANSNSSVTVRWTNASAVASAFLLQRSTDGTNFSTIATPAGSATSYVDTGLAASTGYYYRVLAVGPGNHNSAQSNVANALTNPEAPSNLATVARSSSRIDLSWTNNSSVATGYNVQRSANGGTYVTIASLTGISSTQYSDANLVEGVNYTYRVQAVRDGSASAFSATVSSTTLPSAPTALTASADGLVVNLSWNDNSSSESGFQVQRSSNGGIDWETLATTAPNESGVAAFVDNTAGQGVTYTYQVIAVNAAGASAASNTQTVTIAPAAPSGLTAVAASGTEIDLSWTDNSLGETGIYVERSDNGTDWLPVTTTAAFETAYADTGLTAGATYYYRISAVNGGGASTYATATGVTAPNAPATITATPVSTSEIDLAFTPVSGATSYIIQRTAGDQTITLNPITNTTYSDTNLTEGTQYAYTVTAVNAGGSSMAGGPIAATTLPAAPDSVVASGITATSVLVTWANHSRGAQELLVQRSADNGDNWVDIAHVAADQTSITDSSALESHSYIYRVQASNAGGSSTSAVSSPMTTAPAAPTQLTGRATSATSVSLSWTNNSTGATSYVVQRGVDGENFTDIGSVDSATSAFTDAHGVAATRYYYRVYAVGNGGPSDYSNTSQATTIPAAPQNVVATAASATRVGLAWTAVSGATGYNILRSTDGASFAQIDTAATNSYSDTAAVESTQYWYEVEATNASGSSVDSVASAPVTTVPSAPASLAVSSTTAGQVALSWINTSHAVTGFTIERSSNNGVSFSQVGTALSTDSTYVDSASISEGSHYIYRVRATGAGGVSDVSNTIGADTNPAAPTSLQTVANSATSITVSWANVSTSATGYTVSRSDNGGAFNVVATLGANAQSFQDTVAEDGSYRYKVRATQLLSDDTTTLLSTWTGPQTVTTVPAAPDTVQATAISASEVDLTWNNNSPTATGFNILRSNADNGWDSLGSVGAGTSLYQDLTAAPGTQYRYEVIAVGANGASAPATSSALTSIPPSPTINSATTANNPQVLLTWNDVPGEAGFHVQRNDGNGWVDLGNTEAGVTQYIDTTSVEDAAYQYRVSAFNASGASDYSDAASASTFLGAPTDVTITASTSTAVDLSWTDASVAATGYEVQRSDNGGDWQSLTTDLSSQATSYQDTTVLDGVSYSYRVRALQTAGNSDFAYSGSTRTPVLAPTGLTATSVSTSRVDLAWTNPSATATSFQIWRSVNGSDFVQIDTVSGGTSYTDATLTAGQTASYEVFASNSDSTSPASAPTSGSARPAAPSDLQVQTPNTPDTLHLTWTDNTDGATGYQIYRDTGDGFTLLATVRDASARSYDDTGLTEGSTYTYEVFASNAGGLSTASNVAENTTLCSAPTDLAVSSATASSITLAWTNTSLRADGYAVAMSTDGGASFHPLDASFTLTGGDSSFTVTGLSEATQYQFQVYAYNASGPSAVSNTIAPTTLASAPSLDSVSADSEGVHVSWTNTSSNAGGYIVQRSSDGGATYPDSFAVDLGTTSFTDTTALANGSYTYQVVTTDAGGSSLPSSSSTVLTLPAAPTHLLVRSTTSSSATLTWRPDAGGAGAYTIARSNGGGWTTVGSALGTDSSFTDNTAVAGTAYVYQLIATNTTGSAPAVTSSQVTVLTAAVSNLTSTAITDTTVSLSWSPVQGASNYDIQRSSNGTDWQTIGATGASQTTFTDVYATEATTFSYRVCGENMSGFGDFSTPYAVLTVPAAPSDVVATPVSETQVNLAWADHSQGAAAYDIYRSANGGPDVRIAHGLDSTATTFTDNATTAGYSYVYKVYAYNDTGSSTAATQTALTVPPQPQSLAATAPSASEIDLTWNSALSATQYTIMRSPNGADGWTEVGQVDGDTLSFQDSGLTEGTTYFYNVIASNATGAGAAASISAPTLPAGVISLSVSSASATQVNLSWMNNSGGSTGYDVYRQTNNAGDFTLVAAIHDASVTSFDDTVTEGTAYTYRVMPTDASGEGVATDISITTVPATPTLTAATPFRSANVTLTWTNNSANGTGFTIQRSLAGQNIWTTVTSSLRASAVSYNDSTATGGTEYDYKVIEQGAGGNSADSNILTVLTAPPTVMNVEAAAASTTQINLTWGAVPALTEYKILRAGSDYQFVQIGTTDAQTTSYSDTGLTEGTRYHYFIVPSNSSGDGFDSPMVTKTTLALAPSGLTASIPSSTEVDLTWTNNSANAASVGIERSVNGTTWTQIATTGNNSTNTYQDTGLSAGTTYFYRVTAIDEGGTNYMSDVASVAATTLPDAPTLTASPVNDGTVSLDWSTPTGATTFTVERSSGGSWSPVVTATTDTSFNDVGLAGNTTYQYRVLASNGSGDGSYGSPVSVLTVPDAPSGLVPVATGTSTMSLTWSGDTGANVKYSIYRAPVAGGSTGTYVKVASVTGALAYSDTGLTAGASYAYEVVASNASGQIVTPALSSQVITFPAAVQGLSRNIVSATEVDLTWTASAGATSYTVSRMADGDSGYTLLTVSPLSAGATSYNDTSALSGTSYTYKVTAINGSGASSNTIAALTYPAAVTGLTVSVVDNHTVSVSWTAVSGATSYTLQRSTNGGDWQDVTGYSGTSVSDTVAGGATEAYQVKASNATGDSAFVTTASVTTVPDAAADVAAVASSDTSVHLTWSLSAGADSYVVMRSDDGGATYNFTSITLAGDVNSYDDSGLTELTPYTYKVVASNSAGNAADSMTESVVTRPTAASGLNATAISSAEVDLAWTDNTGGRAGVEVQRNDGSGWTNVEAVEAGTTTYRDTTVLAGTSYTYRVVANNDAGLAAPSNLLTVLTVAAAPTNIVATPASATEVDLAWDAMTGAASYDITVSADGGSYTSLATSVTENSYAFSSAVEGTSYQFKIVANNTSGSSAAGVSNAALTVPAAPANIVATAISGAEVDLTWDASHGATSYTVFRSDNGSPFYQVGSGITGDSFAASAQGSGDEVYEVQAVNATGAGAVGVSNHAFTQPDAVGEFTTRNVTASEVDLTWMDFGSEGYKLDRTDSNGVTVSWTLDGSASQFADTNDIQPGMSYTYALRTSNSAGYSLPANLNVLTLPSGVSLTGATVTSNSTIDLAWSADTGTVDGYRVYRQANNSGSFEQVGPDLSPDTTSFTDTGLTSATDYVYTVVAFNTTGEGDRNFTSTLTTLADAPTGLQATGVSDSEVDLSWTGSTGATGYEVDRQNSDNSWTAVDASIPADTTSFADTGLSGGTSYTYRVEAIDNGGASAASDTQAGLTRPGAPASFQATPISAGEVDLSWTASTGATSYTIERAAAGGDYSVLDTGVLGAGADSFSDTTVQPGTTYAYRIHATDASGDSVTATQTALTVPQAVTINSASVVSDSEVSLSWTASEGIVDGYRVLRYDAGSGVFTQIGGDLSADTLSFNDTTASAATAYVYRVLAFNTTGNSGNSDTNTLTTLPTTPANFAAHSASSSEIDLSWDAVAGATGYKIERQDGSDWVTLSDTVDAAATSYQDTGLPSSTSFTYRIEAIDAGGLSVPTSSQTALTRPDIATNLAAASINGSEIDLSWDAVPGATGYIVMGGQSGGTNVELGTTTGTTYADTGLPEESNRQYAIIAYNAAGNGAATETVTAATRLNTPDVAVTAITTNSVTIHWTNHSTNDIAYWLDRETSPGTWDSTQVGGGMHTDGQTGSYTVTGLTEATNYNFRLYATDYGIWSNFAYVTPSTVPNAPTSLAGAAVSPTQIDLSWTNNSAGADTQVVERYDGSAWTAIATIAGDASSYSDTTVTEATAYQYAVYATKGSSISAQATSSSVTSLPLAPTALAATVASPTEIDLAWTDHSAAPTAYRVYRSTDGVSFAPYGSDLAFDATSFQDTNAPESATTYYRIVAVDAGGESTAAAASATTPLSAPTTLVAATTTDTASGDKTVDLSWANTSTVATAIKIERSSGGDYAPLVTLDPGATSWADDTALENTAYTYRIYAVDGSVNSTQAVSNSVTTVLSRPTSLALSTPSATSVALTWNDVSAAATSYHIERSTDGVHFSEVGAVLSGAANNFTDTGLSDDTNYYYRVRAASADNTSNYSDAQNITTIPATPTDVSATPFSTSEIDLAWTDVSTSNTGYTVERSDNGGVDWAVLANLNGTATSYSDTGIAEGTDHEYEVIATGAGGNSLASTIAPATTLPAAPTSLSLAASSASSVTVNWTDNSTGATSYEIQRYSGGSWTTLDASLPASATSFTDSTVTEGTAYQYQVRASRNGTNSDFSNSLSVTTQPAAPSALAVSSMTSSRVTLAWTDNSNGETGFTVSRSTNGGAYSVVGTLGANSTTFSDNTVAEGMSYSYTLCAYNAGGNSTSTDPVVANIPPAAPTNLATTSISSTSVALSWTNHSTHQSGFYVERSIDGGVSFTQIADVTSGTAYTDNAVSEASSYQYRVRAYGATGASSYSGSLSVSTPVNAPTNLNAAVVSATEIDLTWTDNSNAESGYSLQRSTNGGSTWSTTISLAANTTSYRNTGLTEGTTYTYRLQATRTGKNSAYTPTLNATTLPASPSSVTASVASDTQVTVAWTNNSVGATGFTIQRSTDGVNWATAGSVSGGTLTFTDSGLTEYTTYSYRVEATNGSGASAWANAASSATTLPTAPSALRLSAPAADRIQLDWTDNSTAATGYKVERNDGSGWTQIALVAANATTYTDLTVNEATLYTYRVRAVAGSLNSVYSNAPSLTTVPLDPDSLAATPVSTSEIDLTWNNNSAGATNYIVERSVDGGQTFSVLATLDGSATSYADTGLTEGTDYQYRVRAQDAGGYSGYTSSADAVTFPAQPGNLTATPSVGQIVLNWTDNSSGESSYSVERFNGGIWTPIASLPADSNSFTDTGATGGLSSGTTYQYRVFCTDTSGDSLMATVSAVAA